MQRTGEHSTRSGPGQRQADLDASTVVERLGKWFDNSQKILGGAGFILALLAAGGGWLGAQWGVPKRVTGLDARMTNEVTRLDGNDAKLNQEIGRIDASLDTLRSAYKTEITVARENIELLLRIACPTQQRADLLNACRPYSRR